MDVRIVRLSTVKNYEWNEWQVLYRLNGKLDEMLSYYASDKEDALSTQNEMVRRLCEQGFRLNREFDTTSFKAVELIRES